MGGALAGSPGLRRAGPAGGQVLTGAAEQSGAGGRADVKVTPGVLEAELLDVRQQGTDKERGQATGTWMAGLALEAPGEVNA